MPMENAASKASGMLSNLKSRLGFSHEDEDRHEIDSFEQYDDFDDDGFNEQDDKEFAGYGSDYDDNAPVGGFKPASTRSSRFGRADSSPDLVTINDLKARTQSSDDHPREARTSWDDGYKTTRSGGRDLIENTGPAQSSPAYQAARNRSGQKRSEGLNSLFEPTGTAEAYDPYDAYSGSGSSTYSRSRHLTVIRPLSYGDVVVLVMRTTPDDLSKRILDFSFGVASALDASVECPGKKVFAIARGNALSEEELRNLRQQGAL